MNLLVYIIFHMPITSAGRGEKQNVSIVEIVITLLHFDDRL